MRRSIMERAARRLDIPVDLAAGLPRIEIRGRGDIYIENHRGLLEYGTNEVHVNGGDMIMKLSGEGFVIKAMTDRELRVEGLLFNVEYVY